MDITCLVIVNMCVSLSLSFAAVPSAACHRMQVEAVVLSTLQELSVSGFKPEHIEASLNTLEFVLREFSSSADSPKYCSPAADAFAHTFNCNLIHTYTYTLARMRTRTLTLTRTTRTLELPRFR